MASTIRSFIAINLTPEHKRSVGRIIKRLSAQWPEYRWVNPDELHLTLNFLGDVPDSKVPQVCEIMRDVATRHGEFTFEFSGLGAFPKNSRPRILWLGVDEGRSNLSKIHYELSDALEELRLERDRKGYRPHLTLGRIRGDSRWPDSMIEELESGQPVATEPAEATELVLIASFSDGSGPMYTVMDRAALG